jgi:hypothetical protein
LIYSKLKSINSNYNNFKLKTATSYPPDLKGPSSSVHNITAAAGSMSLEDAAVWNHSLALHNRGIGVFEAGPNKSTTNVAWLVGGPTPTAARNGIDRWTTLLTNFNLTWSLLGKCIVMTNKRKNNFTKKIKLERAVGN